MDYAGKEYFLPSLLGFLKTIFNFAPLFPGLVFIIL